MKRYIRFFFWMFFGACIGALYQTKTPILRTEEVLIGALIGASIGFFFASIFNVRAEVSHKKHKDID